MMKLNKALLGAAAITLCAQAGLANGSGITLNEIYISHSGTDDMEYYELHGPASASLDGYMILVVEGDGAAAGTLDRAIDLTGNTIPSDCYFVAGGTAVTNLDLDLGGTNLIENGTETIYLISTTDVAGVTALLGTDVDGDGDLVTDIATNANNTIVDIIAAGDGGLSSGDLTYDGAQVLGPDGSFLPAGIYRGNDAPNGWCPTFLDFDDVANADQPRTPGAANVACGAVITTYCTAGTTTNGCLASAGSTGTPSASLATAFTIQFTGVEGDKQGIIFYGVNGPTASTWGSSSSFLCVKAPTQRTGAQNSGGTAGVCDGVLDLDWNAYQTANPGSVGNPFSAGDTVWAQGWFRDPPSPKTTHLSNGLQFTLAP